MNAGEAVLPLFLSLAMCAHGGADSATSSMENRNSIDWDEPERVAQAVKAMDLKHAVITSVDRDDDNLGGAKIFAMVIERIRAVHPGCSIEVLIPDFRGDREALKIVMNARPEILNHNLETVPRLFPVVQASDKLEWSQAVLTGAKEIENGCPDKIRHHAWAWRNVG